MGERSPSGVVKLVCFELHGQEYAADIRSVKETIAVRPITRVFLTPPHLAGIINLRGDIVAVIDLGQLLGLARTEITDDSRIVVVREGGGSPGFSSTASPSFAVSTCRPCRTLPQPFVPTPQPCCAG